MDCLPNHKLMKFNLKHRPISLAFFATVSVLWLPFDTVSHYRFQSFGLPVNFVYCFNQIQIHINHERNHFARDEHGNRAVQLVVCLSQSSKYRHN